MHIKDIKRDRQLKQFEIASRNLENVCEACELSRSDNCQSLVKILSDRKGINILLKEKRYSLINIFTKTIME